MNVLVMSISSKVPLLKAIKHSLYRVNSEAKLYGSDVNHNSIGQYFVDVFWICPPLADLKIDDFITYCHANRITAVIPTRDGELLYFAKHKAHLASHGVYVMISDEPVVRLCLDKILFSERLLDYNFPVIPSFVYCPDGFNYYVVKERYGAGSQNVGLKLKYEEAIIHARKLQKPIFQPYIEGEEYSVDVFVHANRVKGVVVRSRDVVVRGESQVTTTVSMPKVEQLIQQITEKCGFDGHIVFQILLNEFDEIYVIECNGRIGGASTLSFAVGLTSLDWFFQYSAGYDITALPFVRSQSEKKMIRHAEDFLI